MKRQILKILVKKDVGLTVKYKGERDKKGTPHEVNEKVMAEPESEFTSAMKRMGGFLIKCSSLGHAEHALNQDRLSEQISTADKPSVIKNVLQYISAAVRVDCVELTWSDAGIASVAITGTFTNHVGDSNKVSGPAIQLDQNVYGFETRLKKDIEKLVEATDGYTQLSSDEQAEDEAAETAPVDDEDEKLPQLRKVG